MARRIRNLKRSCSRRRKKGKEEAKGKERRITVETIKEDAGGRVRGHSGKGTAERKEDNEGQWEKRQSKSKEEIHLETTKVNLSQTIN